MALDPKQIEELFWKLPPELQEAITSAETATHLQQIGKVHGLHLDDLDVIFEEVGRVMLGLNKPENFGVTIRSRLGLADEKSRAVVRSIDDEIFQPIRKSLMTITEKERGGPSSASFKAPEAPPQTVPVLSSPFTGFTGHSIPIPESKESSLPKTSEEVSREEILNQIENPQDIPQKSSLSQSTPAQEEKDSFAEKYPDLAGVYASKNKIPEPPKDLVHSEESSAEKKEPLPPPINFTPTTERISSSQTTSSLAYPPTEIPKGSKPPKPVEDPLLKTEQKTITEKHEVTLTPKDVPPPKTSPAYMKVDPYRESF